MRPVHVRVGHDDDLVVAQIVEVELRAHANAERLAEVVDLGIGRQLARGRAQYVEDLALKRQQRLFLAVARALAGAAGAVALDDEKLRALARFAGAIGQPDAHAGEIPCAYVELVDGAAISSDELIAFANEHIHERAAFPKYLEILDELPKTAVEKIFKPDLRKRAITRIYNEALADVAAEVREVTEDKKRGLVARIAKTGDVDDQDITKALGAYTVAWEIVE